MIKGLIGFFTLRAMIWIAEKIRPYRKPKPSIDYSKETIDKLWDELKKITNERKEKTD